jgi:hypothetical protein
MRQLCTLILIGGIGISAGGCSHFSCTGWSEINPSGKDKMTEGTERQILKHNLYGAAQGCWPSK